VVYTVPEVGPLSLIAPCALFFFSTTMQAFKTISISASFIAAVAFVFSRRFIL
jgi:hypothetical protein